MCDDRPIYSRQSMTKVFLNFVNHCGRNVDVFWIDYTGKPKFMLYMAADKPKELYPINTFVLHPFEFRDRHTHERMYVDHNPIYWPQPWCILFNNLSAQQRRVTVRVHFPVRSLYETAAWQVLMHRVLHGSSDKSDAVVAQAEKELAQLELPHIMQNDVRAVLGLYMKRRS